MRTGTTISLVVGAWGAGLSSYLAWRSHRQDRCSLHVRCRDAYDVKHLPGEIRGLQEIVEVIAVNDGHRPVQINRVAFVLDDGSSPIGSMPPGHQPQPQTGIVLQDGESARYIYARETFDRIEKEEHRCIISAVVYDAGEAESLAPCVKQ